MRLAALLSNPEFLRQLRSIMRRGRKSGKHDQPSTAATRAVEQAAVDERATARVA